MKTLLTQLSESKYDELVEGWINGSLQEKWKVLNGQELTKKQQVEERQIRAIAMIFSQPEDSSIRQTIRNRRWKELKFYKTSKGIILEVTGY